MWCDNQAAVGFSCELSNTLLDLVTGVHSKRSELDAERRRGMLGSVEEANIRRSFWTKNETCAFDAWGDFSQYLDPFAAN
jgi:hypothetical protein